MINQVKALKEHCKFCFETLIAKLTQLPSPKWPQNLPEHTLPIFVTWTQTHDEELRGCIGTFQPSKLSKILGEYALRSSLKDPRFKPVKIEEIQGLTVSVSLLVNFQNNKRAFDWELGKHGIIIEFTEKGRSFNATFLPEVAVEQKWTQEETLTELIEKAGYRGRLASVVEKIVLTTYQSSQAHMSYQEYVTLLEASE